MNKLIINCETGKTVDRELNKTEKDQQKIDEVEAFEFEIKIKAETQAKAAQRQLILDKLGLTADEAQLLIG
jgi:hypothetical protein